VRIFLGRFYKKVVDIKEEWMYGYKIGRQRKVDILKLECGHVFWQEKGDIRGVEERICDNCLRDNIISLEDNNIVNENIVTWLFNIWDEKLRRWLTE
jgi:hypothetical protein